ncbi:hypothetical protein Taro_055984 [Colocasia esculenta]|uniref:Aminotransferase-like plant mobile domain-containing protein n=1 Tax=Colocasia esculenta TaxID=4460 RepID=A0A843XVX6_COLES|nr:hypothetical protein [Colocasia esculenta]
MEGEKNSGEGSSQRKHQAEWWSSRRQTEAPPAEEEVDVAEMAVEEEEETPIVNVEEERRKRTKAMRSQTEPLEGTCRARSSWKRGSDKGGSGRSGPGNASARPAVTWCPDGAGCHNHVAETQGEMRARVSWVVVLAVFLAFPPFQRERVEEMGFGGIFRIERMRADSAHTQALRSRWDAEATAFVFPWGHMIPSLEDVSQITGLRTYGRPVSGYTYPCYHDLAERLLELPVERRSSLVPRVPLQESLGLFDVGKVAGESEDEHLDRLTGVSRRELGSEPGAQVDLDLRRFLVLFLGRLLFTTRGDAVHYRFLPLLEDLAEVGGYAWGAAFLTHQFDSLGASEQQTSISGFFPFLQVVWQPYLGEGDEGQPWLVQARPYFGRSVWLHALNLVLPIHLFLSQCSLGLRQSAVEFSVRDRFRRPGWSFRGLHDTTNWRERVDVAGEIASLRASLYSAVQDREADSGAVLRAEEAQRHLEERERDLQLTTEHSMDLQGERDRLRGEVQTTRSERDQLRIRVEAAEAQVAEATKELVTTLLIPVRLYQFPSV